MSGSKWSVGDTVWAHTGSEASFEKGVIERIDGHKGMIAVKLKGSMIDVKEGDVHRMNTAVQDGLPDNTYLRELNEATLLHNVRTRYNDPKDDGGCYSVTGHILIAVNPFRKLTVYEESNVRGTRLPACTRACTPDTQSSMWTLRAAIAAHGGAWKICARQLAAGAEAVLHLGMVIPALTCGRAPRHRLGRRRLGQLGA